MQKVEKKMTQSYVLPWKEKELESGRKNILLCDEAVQIQYRWKDFVNPSCPFFDLESDMTELG